MGLKMHGRSSLIAIPALTTAPPTPNSPTVLHAARTKRWIACGRRARSGIHRAIRTAAIIPMWPGDLPDNSTTATRVTAALWLCIFLLLCLSITLTRSRSLRGPDESREAGMAREMADSGDFVVPRLNGDPFWKNRHSSMRRRLNRFDCLGRRSKLPGCRRLSSACSRCSVC